MKANQTRSSTFSVVLTFLLFWSTLGTGLGQSTLQFSANTYTVPEWAGSVTLTVQRANDASTEISVDYATADGTATNGLKYISTNGTLAFAAGETNQTIVVPILNDGFVEGTKTFRVTLSNPTDAVLGSPALATVSITDNDFGVQFQSANYSVAEDAGAVLLGVVRGDNGTLPVTVGFTTTNLTAKSGVDYTGTNITLSFGPSERFKLVPVPILNNNLKEGNKNFRATLNNPAGATLGSQTTTTVTIVDNDLGAQFELANYTVAEDAGAVLIRVLRGNDDTNSPMTVDYTITGLTAINGLDYTGTNNPLVFAPGEKVKVLRIPILNDGVKEASETFLVTLSNPSGGILGPRTNTTVTILDNDPGLGFELSSYSVCEKAKAGEITLAVVRGNDGALGPITVQYATADVTAKAGQDYQAKAETLPFQENETLKSLTIPILRPTPTGGTKTFRVTLTNPTGGATLGTSTTTVNILENYPTLTPPVDARLTIRREGGVNVLTWTGDGQLQRADRVEGPWQTLAAARSPWTVESPVPVTFYQDKGTRSVNLYVPSRYGGQTAMPLVILLHGYTVSGQAMEDWIGFRPLAEARGFLYCYPDGTVDRWGYRFWNATDACCDFGSTGIDDAGYLRGVIEEIARRFAVDRKRIYLVGVSNGGFMAYRMACQHADLIAGIASVAGMTFLGSNYQPSQPVHILHIHGTADTTVPYAGGSMGTPMFPSNLPPLPGALQSVQMWAGYNGCVGQVTDAWRSLDLDLNVPGLDTVVTCYTNCPPGGAVELWSVEGVTHSPALSAEFSPRVIDWLLAHPKP